MNRKVKYLILGLLLFSSFLSLNLSSAKEQENANNSFKNIMFSDVDTKHKNFDAIYFLYNNDIIEGYKEGKVKEYKPENKINRAEFLKLLLEGTQKANHKKYEKCFPDVDAAAWYSTYICQAKEAGIISGYGDGKFRPDQTITEVEALKILGEVEDWQISQSRKEEAWYLPYLDFANNRNITTEENSIDYQMTRGDIAEIIFRNTQIKELKVNKFEEKLVDELFYNFEIPYGGPMGPGGLFGPGGFFGEAGAFDNSAYFAGKQGHVEMLDEDFYKDRYCYYSDQGDFQDQVEDILNFISDGKLADIELDGYDLDGFGVIYCYNGIAATHLQLFTKELRDEYKVQCWFDPMFSKSTEGYERILCYSKPEKPDWLSEDNYCEEELDKNGQLCSTCYKDVISKEVVSHQCSEKDKPKEEKELEPGKDLYIEINGREEITAGGKGTNIEVFLRDNDGNPIKNRQLRLVATTGIDYSKEFEVKEVGMGVYRTNFATKLAGLYVITIIDDASGTKNDATLRVNPGPVDHIQIVDKIEPYQSPEPNKAAVRIVSKDKYDNTVPYSSSENNLTAITSMGKVDVSHYNDIFYFEVTADDWGKAELSIKYRDAIIDDQIKFNFYPIQIGMPKGISLEDQTVEAPISIYFPEKYGKIGSYDFKINTKSKVLNFTNLVDFNEQDEVTMPLFDVQNGFIHVWQPKTEVNLETPEILTIGTILFDVTNVGDGTIYISDAVLTPRSEKFINDVSGEISGFGDGLWGGTHVVKPTKNICLEAFVLPLPAAPVAPPLALPPEIPSATEADIDADVSQANEIFKAIAKSCNCKFYLNFELKTPVTTLTQDQTNVFDENHNGIIESDGHPGDANADDIDRMMANHPASPGCIPVYYTPQVNSGGGDSLLGLSRNSLSSNGVVMNNALDNDGRTLAHELAHQLSRGEVDDPDKPDSHAEGADQAGNLMNYENTGDNLTPLQCEEIEKKFP